MGFKKLGLFFFVIILFQIQLHPLHTHPLQNTSTATTGLQGIVSVDRRGGGGGGHGGGGHASHSTGSRAHGGRINGDEGYKHGSTVVPLYVAGAMSHHQNNHQRHGSNEASPNHAGSSYLVLTALAVSLLTFFA
ncbi:uncharacterized protein LOC110613813 [Manihot esculenta]|uniref:Glycine-rich protein n=1 Tax=Manihot esculenta TaxID=3983 RepID=A0A2C9W0R6_MANES|nr:uncharacterized protein LOC110613813 [Manihot esculenta]OAY51391.1 hypothetical protein MANES_04G002500v8 [Manihot esculenta]